MKELNEIMKKNLKSARIKAQFTQVEAAKKLNISAHTVSIYENRPVDVPLSKLGYMCQLYGCNVRELLKD